MSWRQEGFPANIRTGRKELKVHMLQSFTNEENSFITWIPGTNVKKLFTLVHNKQECLSVAGLSSQV
jgi:hypothetical protein